MGKRGKLNICASNKYLYSKLTNDRFATKKSLNSANARQQ